MTAEWMDQAACRDADPDLFFPITTTGPDHDRQVAEAKAVCRKCPVLAECSDRALDRPEPAGIWGAMTEEDRRKERRRRSRTAKASVPAA